MRNNSGNVIHKRIIALLCTLLFSSFYIFNLNTSGSFIMAAIVVVMLLVTAFYQHGKIKFTLNRFYIYTFFFSIFCLASSLWAVIPSFSIEKGITIIEISLCMLAVDTSLKPFKDSTIIVLKSIFWGSTIVVVYTIARYGIQRILIILRNADRLANDYTNINSIGMAAAISIVICVTFILNEGFKLYNLFLIPAIVLVAGSGSKKALFIVFVGVIMTFLFKDITNLNFSRIIKGLLGGALIAVVLFYVMKNVSIFAGTMNRLDGFFNAITGSGGDSSSIKRLRYIEIGLEQFYKTPILGIGIGNARTLTAEGVYLHNNFIELLAGGGILGFILYYISYYYEIVNMWKYRRKWRAYSSVLFILCILLLLLDFGAVSYYSKIHYFYFMVIYMELTHVKFKGYDNDYI